MFHVLCCFLVLICFLSFFFCFFLLCFFFFFFFFFFFSSRRRHTRFDCDWSSDVCSSDLGLNDPNRFIDNGDYILARRVHTLALNNTWLPSSNTVVTLRYGWTQFIDDDTLSIDFDPATLGFNPAFSNAIQTKKFPAVNITDYYTLGAIDPSDRNWYSWSANGAVSRLVGRHTFKAGMDYRRIGNETQSFSGGAGDFNFARRFTSAIATQDGVTGATPSGNALASLMLGYPSGDPGNLSRILVSD